MDLENYDAPYLTTEEHAVLDHSGVPYGNAPPTTQYDAPYLTTPEHALIDHTGIPVDSESPTNNSLYDAPYLTVDEHSHIDHTGIPGAGDGPSGLVCVLTLIPQDLSGPVGGDLLVGSIHCTGVDPGASSLYALATLNPAITFEGGSAESYGAIVNCSNYLDSDPILMGDEFTCVLSAPGNYSVDGFHCFGVLNDPGDWVGVLELGQATGVDHDGAVGELGIVTLVIG